MTTQTEKRPNVVYSVDQKDIDTILAAATELDLEFEVYEGVLNDNYIIQGTDRINLDGDTRKNIIILCSYENIWSSSLELIMTDDFEEVEKYKQELAA